MGSPALAAPLGGVPFLARLHRSGGGLRRIAAAAVGALAGAGGPVESVPPAIQSEVPDGWRRVARAGDGTSARVGPDLEEEETEEAVGGERV